MALDHEAIYKAYPGTVVSVDDGTGAFDKDGNSVTLDQTKIDAANVGNNIKPSRPCAKTRSHNNNN